MKKIINEHCRIVIILIFFQLVSEAVLKETCEEHPLCVVSVLPHILDCQSKCRNDYLKILQAMGEKFKNKMWGYVISYSTFFFKCTSSICKVRLMIYFYITFSSWVWSEAGAQPDLEGALDIGGFGYPAMAVVNTKKMKYSILRGSFSGDGIKEFLRLVKNFFYNHSDFFCCMILRYICQQCFNISNFSCVLPGIFLMAAAQLLQ